MPALKLTFISSLYAKTPTQNLNKLLLRTPTIATAKPPQAAARRPEWRITPCAPRTPFSAHDNVVIYRKLGFRGVQFSSKYKGGELGGAVESGGSGLLNTDMGSENNNKEDQWLENDCSPTSTLPSHNHHQEHRKKPAVAPPPQPSRHQSTKLLTLPTILTIGRVAAVPLLVCTFYMNSWWGTTATTCIFIAAAITDWLDGYLARKMNLGSAFGAFLDPVADKLMVAATLVLLCTRPPEVAIFGQLPWLLTVPSIAIIGREITMSAVREWAASQNSKLSEAVAVNNLGKWKTAAQMSALTILLVTRDSSLAGPGVLVASGVALLYVSAWLAVWSLLVYMKKIWKVLLM